MSLNSNIKRTCSFFVSKIHLVTMILPYIYKKTENQEHIKTILEYDLENEINLLISKMNFKESMKEELKNVSWKKSSTDNTESIDINENDIFFIVGSNYFIDKYIKKLEKEKSKIFSIISCFDVTQEQNNIKDILKQNEYILNTMGEKSINDIFKEEKKRCSLRKYRVEKTMLTKIFKWYNIVINFGVLIKL